MWKVNDIHRASRLPDSESTRHWSTPWFVPNSPDPVAPAGIRTGGAASRTLSEPSGNNQGNWNDLPYIFICNLSATLNRNSEKSLFFWKIGRVIIFSSLLALTQPSRVCVYSGPCVQQHSSRLCNGPWFAHWPFVPVECCACRAEVIINWCLAFFVWLSLSDVIAAPLTNAELSLWEVSLKRGIWGATVGLKIWAPFYKKHMAHCLWNMFFTESERNKVFYRWWAQLQLFLFINVQPTC